MRVIKNQNNCMGDVLVALPTVYLHKLMNLSLFSNFSMACMAIEMKVVRCVLLLVVVR